ncbi:NADH-quinone oxidoreductase subunit L [Ammonifex thiophilus]|uniref:NADH-quinone oxidoreductase subunit L n=1 Tax=Ammonifex thiophilus TaxID=444093 RepID=A0A3D8P469_9THEO|nr:proton-conducting transporter membrane subunit [Ammonifex thiophilus]RDV82459.1 NADH-quinone oxidoreductase subunit L [Ammonifex thiophilus]
MRLDWLVAWLVLLPIVAGLLSLSVYRSTLRKALVLGTAAILAFMAVLLAAVTLGKGSPQGLDTAPWLSTLINWLDFALVAYFLYVGFRWRHYLVAGLAALQGVLLSLLEFWQLPHGLTVHPTFLLDPLASIMVLVISVIGSLICVYALDYMPEHEAHLHLERTRQPLFFCFLVGFLGVMNGLVMANNLLWLFFFWEMTTLCCYELIRHDRTEEAQASALRALWMNLIGGVACVLAMFLIYRTLGTLSLVAVVQEASLGGALLLPLAFLSLTAFTKAAQVPFQSWLLGAMVAPTPVSALLHSSTMVKAGVYLVLRLAPALFGTVLSSALAVFGAFVYLAASLLAISQTVSKRVLALSTVANLGLIIACAGINTDLALAAALVILIFHALSKGLLFMTVGIYEQQLGSRDIEVMEGLVNRSPVAAVVGIVGMLSMAFVPFGAVLGKWASLEAAATSTSAWFPLVAAFIAVGSAASLVFWVKWLGRLLSTVPLREEEKLEKRKGVYAYGTVLGLTGLLLVASVLVGGLVRELVLPAVTALGYQPQVAANWSGWGSPYGFFTVWPVFLVAGAALLLPLLTFRARREDYRPVYLCGENLAVEEAAFRGIGDQPVPLETGGLYLSASWGEARLNPWINLLGLMLLLVILLVAGVGA